MKKLSAISLFSGAGGMDVGVLQAGFDVRAAAELDKHCCETLRENIKREKRKTLVFEGDVRSFSPAEMLKTLKMETGELDLLFGGPPCQAFSQIGKQRALEDERGLLLFQMIRYAETFRPKAILMEQVKGLLSAKDLSGERGGVFRSFVSELEELGYSCKWRTLLAADYGVAQTRRRVFIVAMPPPNAFEFPEPTHDDPIRLNGLFPTKPRVAVGDVLEGLGSPVLKRDGREIPDDGHYDVTPERDRERIHFVPEGEHLSSQTGLPAELLGNLTKKDTTKFLRLSRFKPSNTLRGGEIFFHPIEDRYLTPRECMRIHGYPDSYVLRGPIRGRSGSVKDLDQHRQIGNSVPPPLARAIALKIKEALTREKLEER